MANGCLGWINRLDAGAITAASEIPAAPVTNVITQQGAEPWITAYGVVTSASGARLQCDAGAATTWRAFCLARTNLTALGTVRWRLGTTAGAGDVMDSGALAGVVPGIGQHVHVAPVELTARYLTVDIDDDGNPDRQLMIGFAWAGPVLQPRINFGWDAAEGLQHRTDRAESAGGQGFVRPMWERRSWTVGLQLDQAEVTGKAAEIDRHGRRGASVLFVPRPDGSPMSEAVLGELTDPAPFTWPFRGEAGIRAWRATIVERL
nr:hypothetical protein [uncultured Roseococcus sp.]